LNAGALPVPVSLISQQTVGATLGQDSVQKSLFAGLIGLLAVVIFMILYYRLPGLISVFALVIYAILVLTVFNIFGFTITLSGIAGFVMSLGMAMDANVLIFERMKEELRSGKGLALAIDEGFKRAWPSIRDSNASTLLTCIILFWFTTSLVKGFALTLIIGVLMSMFTAITVSRGLLKSFVGPRFNNWLFLFARIKKSKVEDKI
jgi:preprotein translocase subunit SecD